MNRRRTVRAARSVGAAVVLGALVACTSGGGPQGDPPPEVTDAADAVVDVVRQDVVSVVAHGGRVVATPSVLVRAGADGELRAGVELDGQLEPGEPIAMVADRPVLAPAQGRLSRWSVPDGSVVAADTPVALLTYGGFGVEVDVPAGDAYRIYTVPTSGRANVDGGPGGLECDVVPGETDEREPATGGDEGIRFFCLLPMDAQVLAGLSARVGIETGRVEQALVLPVEAVTGSVQTGTVTKVTDGARATVDVGLGITDGVVIEITSGLEEGDTVLAYAPGLSRHR
ncbi:efflux RND transporter periplasmic adaptor subunit [Cellulomonas bogoriensis]|uniref:Uncharacterized protein n=1 Tax=Cellulomonas bogoriensis 69B4 = DSM 16987 TaxID=1386082 RepID=A0A0A0C312_9CELL|nr:efflux RND transporter periplasmic adaptor subunit [Cellulomonas bogoriensis]KGM14585.1 hypothetical protein N869_05080 [Cellulomonas bogoriensis 69B4 = DSM 16987]